MKWFKPLEAEAEGQLRIKKRWFIWPRRFGDYIYWGRVTVAEQWSWDEVCEEYAEPQWFIIEVM